MARKRRQGDPHPSTSSSSSDDNEKNDNKNKSNCSHIKRAVDVQRLRKAFKSSPIDNENCLQCTKMPNGPAELELTDFEYDRTLWMCLKCGANACGRSVNKHALDHFQTPRSDAHSIAVNTTTFEVWCYECDADVEGNDPKLAQCLDFVKKELNRSSNNGTPNKMEPVNSDVRLDDVEGPSINVESMRSLLGNTICIVNSLSSNGSIPGQAKRILPSAVDQLPRVRGLSNLGNTCFFNAVMQCLAQTPFLLPVLKELAKPNEEFSLSGGKIKLKDAEDEIDLPPISGKLKAWGPLTAALAEALEELQKSGGVYNPRKLFSNLTNIWPQFDGGDQHDSHELLRHLLESVKTEDLNRYKRVILASLNYQKQDVASVPDEMKQKCKFYGQQASERILCPEKVFRGFLVSTLTCQDCYHTSSRHENYLDLSLPVCVDKPAPPIRRKSTPEELSPHKQLALKAKVAAKAAENARKAQRQSSSEDTDADDEGNGSDEKTSRKLTNGMRDTNGNIETNAIKTEKRDDDPEIADKDDSDSKSKVSIKNELVELGISAKGGQELARQISQDDEMLSTSPDATATPAAVLGGGDTANKSTSQHHENRPLLESFEQLKIVDRKENRKKAKRKRLTSYVDWSTTIAPRYQCEDGEYSVQSCLNNFTALELMTGNNKVGCDSCTERIHGKDGKTIYTTATKQFLISSPPAVLILHLKRFQVGPRFMFRKLSKHVTFPFQLDLAPFCASKVKTLPNVHRHQKKLIYSLYGIVEHSGSMHGGHYVAYVKVRPTITADDPRWKFLPKGSKVELDQMDEQKRRLDDALKKNQLKENRLKSGDSDDATSSSSSSSSSSSDSDTNTTSSTAAHTEPPVMRAPPEGKWYYVSDSHVAEASEERVLNAQAYLLFYERIY